MVARTRHRFALFRTVGAAYRFVIDNIGRFIVLAGLPWLGLSIVALSPSAKPDIYIFIVYIDSVISMVPISSKQTLPHDAPLHMLEWVRFGIDIVLVSTFALGWHRFVLTRSVISGISALTLLLRDLRFLAYCILLLFGFPILIVGGAMSAFVGIAVGYSMILVGAGGLALLIWILSKVAKRPSSLALVLFFMATGAVMFHDGMPHVVVSTFLAVLLLVLVAPLGRLLLALPAIAMGETGVLPVTAWHRSDRNGAKLYLGLLGCAAPFEIVRFGVLLQLIDHAHHTGSAATQAAMTALAPFFAAWFLLEVAVVSSYLCVAYRQLGGTDPLTVPAAPDDAIPSAALPSA
jgi:hypothetical protein